MDEDIDKFLAYVDGKAAEGEFTRDIAAEVERIKQHNETKVEYMTLMMELKEQRQEGYDEGRTDGRVLKSGTRMAISFGARQLPISWMTWKKPLGLLNLGYTSTEIAHMLALPKPLAKNWYTRQYDSDDAAVNR